MEALETHLRTLEGHKKGAKYAARSATMNIILSVTSSSSSSALFRHFNDDEAAT